MTASEEAVMLELIISGFELGARGTLGAELSRQD
jgi:hypothetical protein